MYCWFQVYQHYLMRKHSAVHGKEIVNPLLLSTANGFHKHAFAPIIIFYAPNQPISPLITVANSE